MKAIISQAPGEASLVSDVPKPVLRDDYILVKTAAVALNPTDWKHIDFRACKGAIVGCDYCGVVEEVDKGVNKRLKKGDRVAGFTHGGESTNSCFCQREGKTGIDF
jgi:NADPH:quinone reductase-like Zn-dependent oxidoreductase